MVSRPPTETLQRALGCPGAGVGVKLHPTTCHLPCPGAEGPTASQVCARHLRGSRGAGPPAMQGSHREGHFLSLTKSAGHLGDPSEPHSNMPRPQGSKSLYIRTAGVVSGCW